MQRLTARHYMEGESKKLPSALSGSCERVDRKIVRFRGNGKQQENAASEPSKESAYELTETEETSMEATWVYTGPLCIL